MNNLELTEAYAEIEGIEVTLFCKKYFYINAEHNEVLYEPHIAGYLNCEARDKYDVYVDYEGMFTIIYKGEDCIIEHFTCKDEIPKAVIMCIVKAYGGSV